MTDAPTGEHERPVTPFETALQAAFEQAEEVPGHFTIEGNRGIALVVYQEEARKRGPHGEYVDPGSRSTVLHIHSTLETGPNVLDHARSHDDFYLEQAKAHMITRRKARAILGALREPALEPADLVTATAFTLPMLSDLAAARNLYDQLSYNDIAYAILRRGLNLEPEAATQAFKGIVARCDQHKATLEEAAAALVDKFTINMVSRLEKMVSEGRRTSHVQLQADEVRHGPRSQHIDENVIAALEIFDEANWLTHEFWRLLLRIPLESQSLAVTNVLAEKLHLESAEAILGEVTSVERSKAIENVVAAALERARTSHSARDLEKVTTVRQALIGSRDRPDSVSLGKLVKLANVMIRQNHAEELTLLRPDNPFADSAQALALLLQLTLRPDAAPDELARANNEAAIFLRLISGIIEHARVKQVPVIQTVGDLALRFADASPDELRLLKQALREGGLSQVDALRRRQRRRQRRDEIARPGYGEMS